METTGTCGANYYSPASITSNNVSSSYQGITKVVLLKYLISNVGTNDFSNIDDIKIYIYSDVLKQMVVCGSYDLDNLGIINFNNLKIPCIKEIIVTLFEKDTSQSDSYTVRISCENDGEVQREFRLAAFKAEIE